MQVHVERYEKENGQTVWIVCDFKGDLATVEEYRTEADATQEANTLNRLLGESNR